MAPSSGGPVVNARCSDGLPEGLLSCNFWSGQRRGSWSARLKCHVVRKVFGAALSTCWLLLCTILLVLPSQVFLLVEGVHYLAAQERFLTEAQYHEAVGFEDQHNVERLSFRDVYFIVSTWHSERDAAKLAKNAWLKNVWQVAFITDQKNDIYPEHQQDDFPPSEFPTIYEGKLLLWMRNTELPPDIKWVVFLPTVDAFVHLGHLYYFLQTHTPLKRGRKGGASDSDTVVASDSGGGGTREDPSEKPSESEENAEKVEAPQSTESAEGSSPTGEDGNLLERVSLVDEDERAVMYASFAPNTKVFDYDLLPCSPVIFNRAAWDRMIPEITKRECPFVESNALSLGFCSTTRGVTAVFTDALRCNPPKNWHDAADLVGFLGLSQMQPRWERNMEASALGFAGAAVRDRKRRLRRRKEYQRTATIRVQDESVERTAENGEGKPDHPEIAPMAVVDEGFPSACGSGARNYYQPGVVPNLRSLIESFCVQAPRTIRKKDNTGEGGEDGSGQEAEGPLTFSSDNPEALRDFFATRFGGVGPSDDLSRLVVLRGSPQEGENAVRSAEMLAKKQWVFWLQEEEDEQEEASATSVAASSSTKLTRSYVNEEEMRYFIRQYEANYPDLTETLAIGSITEDNHILALNGILFSPAAWRLTVERGFAGALSELFIVHSTRFVDSASRLPITLFGTVATGASLFSVRKLKSWVLHDLEIKQKEQTAWFNQLLQDWAATGYTEEPLRKVPSRVSNSTTGLMYIHGQNHIGITKSGQSGMREFRKHQALFRSANGFPIQLSNSTTVICDKTTIHEELSQLEVEEV
ncbi:unnamed protein product [Amoebophrya sp. A25]|nr:unnamed protein product [Amoebophrya sp. A25]|eukprot:GSA25T00003619001.1